jgi:hypothetical protein
MCHMLVQGLEASLLAIIATSMSSTHATLGEQLASCLLTSLTPDPFPPLPDPLPAPHAGSNILQMLFGSVGAADPVVTDRALAILLEASSVSPALLIAHREVTLSVLESLDDLEAAQARSVCRLLAHVMLQEGCPGAVIMDAADFPISAAVQQHLSTALGSGDVLRMRVAIVGMLEWQFALALAGVEEAELAQNMLEALIGQVARKPAVFAFLCQTLAEICLAQLRSSTQMDPVRCFLPYLSRILCYQ